MAASGSGDPRPEAGSDDPQLEAILRWPVVSGRLWTGEREENSSCRSEKNIFLPVLSAAKVHTVVVLKGHYAALKWISY